MPKTVAAKGRRHSGRVVSVPMKRSKKQEEQVEHGFDLTDVTASNWKAILENVGLDHKQDGVYCDKKQRWTWKNEHITVVACNDPVSGIPRGEVDYASYIGVTGKAIFVSDFVRQLKETAINIKGESKGCREFV